MKRTADGRRAVLLACLMCVSTIPGLTLGAGEPLVCFIAVVLVPLIAGSVLTGSFGTALVLTWASEQIYGMSGYWADIAGVPGRAILLLALIAYFFGNPQNHHLIARVPQRIHALVLFFAIGFPVILLIWGVGVQSNPIGAALGDVLRFGGLLAFYPLQALIVPRPELFRVWLLTTCGLLSAVFTLMTLGPDAVTYVLVDRWVYGGSGAARGIDYARITYEPMIYGYLLTFSGLIALLARDGFNKGEISRILLGTLPTALNFLRGLLAGVGVGFLLLILIKSRAGQIGAVFTRLLPAIIAAVTIAVILLILNPIAGNKLDELRGAVRVSDLLGESRLDQFQLTFEAWLKSPVFGQGVGAALDGYSRSDGLSLEFQWGMILYRTGAFGLLVILCPFIYIAIGLLRNIATRDRAQDGLSNLFEACGLTLVAVAVASVFNPYLASSVTINLFVFYLAIREAARQRGGAATHPVARRRPRRRRMAPLQHHR